MQTEIWDDVPGYDGCFLVSNYGNIKSCTRIVESKNGIIKIIKGIPRKLNIDRNGYIKVTLCLNSIYKTFYVHRLVADVFVENKNRLKFVNHIDCNKQNNYYKNLEWVTFQENMDHASENKLIKPNGCIGINNGRTKLTECQVLEIKKMPHVNAKLVAEKYNISEGPVYGIWSGKLWKHIN